MIKICGHCKYFKENKSRTRFANGYWLGDGKCKHTKATVIGDTCEHWERKYLIKIDFWGIHEVKHG